MEKRIIIAFVLSMLLVSIYNALVLAPLKKQELSIKTNQDDRSSATTKNENARDIFQLEDLLSPKDISWDEELPLVDGSARVSKNGLFAVRQKIPSASEDVYLTFSLPLAYAAPNPLSWKWHVDGNVLKAVAKGVDGPRWVVCGYLTHPRGLPRRYAKYYEGVVLKESSGQIKKVALTKIKGSIKGKFKAVGLYSKYYLTYLWIDDGQFDEIEVKDGHEGALVLARLLPKDGRAMIGIYAGLGRLEFMKGVPDAGRVVKRGVFSGITRVLWVVLRSLYHLTHNWGLSIVFLAVLFSLAFLPLTIKSYTAMKKLQAMQPEMKALQEKYKDDPQKLNQELVLLYAKYGVNPLSGCLPLLLQLPVFFALYPLLLNTYEFKGASFLWIKDLSRPDVAFSVGGFDIHLLPLIVVAIMTVQQRFSSSGQAQQNQVLMLIFPILFLFIFYNMPSGLVLFWLVMSLINIAQQVFIIKKITI